MNSAYTPEYFSLIGPGSHASAEVVVPLVLKIVNPVSVVDVGCGIGAWLATFKKHGVKEILGLDGQYVDRTQLEVDASEFMSVDLAQSVDVGREFDLAISLEVAEHLPESCAHQFVEMLTQLAPVVLFSAAIPEQGGQEHVNEQWPKYWTDRFEMYGYGALDPLRRLLWQCSDVDWWYAQNLLLFVRENHLQNCLRQISELEQAQRKGEILPLIHPQNYQQQTWKNRVLMVAVDLATRVPQGETIILADADCFGTLYLPDRRILPFLERNGCYAGPPADSDQAISELQRMQNNGLRFLAFGWPAFWWSEYYHEFWSHLQQHHSQILSNDRLILFSLRNP